jgi:DNA-binding XRE family transcriptional regulator
MENHRGPLPHFGGHLKAHASADLPAAFRTPDYDKVLGTQNPFPIDHRLHGEWEARRSTAAAEAAQLCARVLAKPGRSWGDQLEGHLELATGFFDIRAAALLLPMPPSIYGRMLNTVAEALLLYLDQQQMPIGEELIATLRTRLAQRHAHWLAQAYTADQQRRAGSSQAVEEPVEPQTAGRAVPAFGKQLAALRKEAHWTVQELAENVGIDRTNVQDHESGKSKPRRKNLRAYEEVFTKALNRTISLTVQRNTARNASSNTA